MINWAIIPVKPLRYGKSRLAHLLSSDERAELTSRLLANTLQVLNEVSQITRCLVVSRDPAVLKIARHHDALTFSEGEKQDLNASVTRAAHVAAAQRATGILILPADLPLLSADDVAMMITAAAPAHGTQPMVTHQPMATISNENGNGYHPINSTVHRVTWSNKRSILGQQRAITICTDHNQDGTNALFVQPPTGFTFQYGYGSFQLHIEEAKRLGMFYRVVHAPGIKFDLDTEQDWEMYQALQGITSA